VSAAAFDSRRVQPSTVTVFDSCSVCQLQHSTAVVFDKLQHSSPAAKSDSCRLVQRQRGRVAAIDKQPLHSTSCKVRLLIILQRQSVSAAAFDSRRAQPSTATVFDKLQHSSPAAESDSCRLVQRQRGRVAAIDKQSLHSTSCRVRLLVILQRQSVSAAAFDSRRAQPSTATVFDSSSVCQLQHSTAVVFDSGNFRQLQIESAILSSAVAFRSRSTRQPGSVCQLQRFAATEWFGHSVCQLLRSTAVVFVTRSRVRQLQIGSAAARSSHSD
jgi:hypothetical protein